MARGYDAATVRDIAAAAGLSTGAVFASFTDKADLFGQVMAVDAQAQIEAMRGAATGSGAVEARILTLLMAAGAYQLAQPQLLRAAEGVSWSHGPSGPLGQRPPEDAAVGLLLAALRQGAACGELSRDADLGLIAETLWDCCLASLHRVLSAGGGLDQLGRRLERQVTLLLAGQRIL